MKKSTTLESNQRQYIENDKGLEIFTIPNFLTDEECDYLCGLIEKNHIRSEVAGSGTKKSTYNEGRTTSTSNLFASDNIVKQVDDKIYQELNISSDYAEPTQGQLYEVGQEFRHHNDYFSGDGYTNHCLSSGQRTYTCMIYLNDVEEGGETDFPQINQRFTPQKKMAIIWKNSDGTGKENMASHHAGMPVKSGKKIIITKWFRENVFNSSEDARLSQIKHNESKMTNRFSTKEQLPKFTPTGFKVVKCPELTWNIIRDAYNLLKDKETEEKFQGKESIIPGDGITSSLLSFDHIPNIRTLIHEQLLPFHQEWCGANIKPAYVYGIRSYKKGATLSSHVDRIETHHISSIIIVDKDLDSAEGNGKGTENDWALDIQDHDGNWHKVYADIGDIILYESAICEHARLEPFKGNFFNNFFVHYTLTDWIYQP